MRSPLVPRLLLATTLAVAATVSAQAQDSAPNGKLLFEDTPGASGISTLTGSCINCHGSVQNRRIAIGGSAFADISFDTAMTRFVQAVQGQPVMNQFSALSTQQARDIAAYIADTPKTSAASLSFAPATVNTVSAAQSVDLTAAVATGGENLQVTGVALSGAGAARFTNSSDTCNLQTLLPGTSCRVSVTFSAPDTSVYLAQLTLTMRQGSSATFTRTVNLTGAVPGSNPPPSGGDDGGGGAVNWYWLAGLGVAVFLLGRYGRRG